MKKSFFCFCVVALMLYSMGCTRSKLDGLVPGSGTVTLNGEIVQGAMIMFSPINPTPTQRSASARSDANGDFRLMTLEPGDGIFPGEYKVIVKKIQTVGGEIPVVSEEDRRNPELTERRETVHLLPQKYGLPSTTDLVVTIPPKGNKSIQLNLEGEVDTTPIPRSKNVKR